MKGFEFKTDNAMNPGKSEEAVIADNKRYVTNQKDNKSILMISRVFGRDSDTEVQGWNKWVKTCRFNIPYCCYIIQLTHGLQMYTTK